MSVWAPVVAALGTGVLGFGGLWWQQRHRDRAAALAERTESYLQLIAHSLSFAVRARTLRETMHTRSGLKEGLDVTLRLRRPADPMELHDWFAQGFEPINQAWSRIQIIGSLAAVDAATQLMDACGDLLGTATETGNARGKLGTTVQGLEWTTEQQHELDKAIRRLVAEREAFINIAREELGKEPAPLRVQPASRDE